jgi:ferredoxin/flavodoxin
MRACLVHFSQTGNTRKVAEAMQETLAAAAGSCAGYRLEETDPAVFTRYDLIGLGCPAFYFREPLNVRRFLLDVPPQDAAGRPKPFFVFVTHGGTPGDVFSRISRLAARRGLATIGAFGCLGADTYPPYADRSPLIAQGHPDAGDLGRARRFAAGMVERALAWQKTSGAPKARVPGSPFTRFVSGLFNGRALRLMERHGILPHKKVDRNNCDKCGLCVQACPQGIIRMEGFARISESGCIYCYHCHRTCPRGAIRCNWAPMRFFSGHYVRKLVQMTFKPRRTA